MSPLVSAFLQTFDIYINELLHNLSNNDIYQFQSKEKHSYLSKKTKKNKKGKYSSKQTSSAQALKLIQPTNLAFYYSLFQGTLFATCRYTVVIRNYQTLLPCYQSR